MEKLSSLDLAYIQRTYAQTSEQPMQYKAVALDLDGTLLGRDLTIRHDVTQAINEIRQAGLKVVVVTGRHHTAARPYHHQLALDTPLMCCNGTYAWEADTGRALLARPLSRTQAQETLRLVRKHDVHTLLYVDNQMTYESVEPHLRRLLNWSESLPASLRPDIHPVHCFQETIESATSIWKFAATSPNLDALAKFGAEIEQSLGLSCEWSGADRVDVAQQGNSKGRLLKDWLDQQGIRLEETIAFGDSPNDISMLRTVGLGVAMANSKMSVQAAAKLVTGSNDSPAIANVLRAHVLQQVSH